MLDRSTNKQQQRGAVTLITALVVLVMLSLLALVGSRVALVQQRVTTNNAEAAQARATAEAGLQAGKAYLIANKAKIASAKNSGWLRDNSVLHWHKCYGSIPPCQIYGNNWNVINPTPKLPNAPGDDYQYKVWYLTNTLKFAQIKLPHSNSNKGSGCQTLKLLDGNSGSMALLQPVHALLGNTVSLTSNLVNNLTNTANSLANLLVGFTPLPDNIGLPTNKLCLPIQLITPNKNTGSNHPYPVIYVVAKAYQPNNTAKQATSGATARVQTALRPTNLFKNPPVAAVMAAGDVKLRGDVRVWGNPTPPTKPPYDFSTLNLNNIQLPVVGNLVKDSLLDVTKLKNVLGNTLSALLGNLGVNKITNPVLEDVLGVNTSQLLNLDVSVTFPLSIWAGGKVSLLPSKEDMHNVSNPTKPDEHQLKGLLGNLTNPQKFLKPLFSRLGILGKILNGVLDFLGIYELSDAISDILSSLSVDQILNTLTGGIDSLIANVGLSNVLGLLDIPQVNDIVNGNINLDNLELLLTSARTCLPQWTGKDTNDGCTPLSHSITAPFELQPNRKGTENLHLELQLPDVQDNTTTLQSLVTGLLKPGDGPDFPSDLAQYIFGTDNPSNASKTVITTECEAVGGSTFNNKKSCALSGRIGSRSHPVVFLTDKDLNLEKSTVVYGVIYMLDGGEIAGPDAAEDTESKKGYRPTIHGSVLSNGDLKITGAINIVYDKARFNGGLAVVPGTWNDTWSKPVSTGGGNP